MSERKYLDLPSGESEAWITDVKFERGTNDKPRNKVVLYINEKPTQESFDGLSTRADIYMPTSSDSVQAKIAMERRVKSILYPLAGLTVDSKTTLKELFNSIQASLAGNDIKVNLTVEHREGTSLDKAGNIKVFTEILDLAPVGYLEKKAYEGSVDFSDSEDIAPF